MATYVNNLRLTELATGEGSGTWGATTNTNLELIGEALGYGSEAIANASTHTITVADGTADSARSFYLKLTGGGQACTVTLAPNTLSKVWMVENTTNSTLTFTQGSGANVAVPAGQVKMIATDGAGSGAVVYDLLVDTDLTGTTTVVNLTASGTVDAATVEFDSLSGTGAVAVTDILDQDDMSSNSATALATQQSIKAYVDSQVGTVDTLAEILANGNTTGGSNIVFGDSSGATDDRLQFGASQDLSIYHTATGNHSIISESGSGNLVLAADNLEINNAANSENKIVASTNGAVTLFYDNVAKLATASGGISVTGEVAATSLDISGDIDVDGTTNLDVVDIDGAVDMASTLAVADTTTIVKTASGVTKALKLYNNTAGANNRVAIDFHTANTLYGTIEAGYGATSPEMNFIVSSADNLKLNTSGAVFNESSADLDFRVESNSNTHMLFVDGGNNRLGINTSSPSFDVDIQGPNPQVNIEATTDNWSALRITSGATQANYMFFFDDTAERARISVLNNEEMNFSTASTPVERLSLSATEAVFNDTGVDTDFRVESEDSASMFKVDAALNQVQITGDSANSDSSLLVRNNYNTVLKVIQDDTSLSSATYAFMIDSSAHVSNMTTAGAMRVETYYGDSFHVNGLGTTVINEVGAATGDFRVESDTNANMLFVDGGANNVFVGGTSTTTVPSGGLGISASGEKALVVQSTAGDTLAVFKDSGTGSNPPYLGSFGDYMAFGLYGGGTVRVGINDTSPSYPLDVNGTANIRSNLILGSSSNDPGILTINDNSTTAYTLALKGSSTREFTFEGSSSGGEYNLYMNNASVADGFNLHVYGSGIFNQNGDDYDFRVESDTNTHMLFVDASANYVGLGTSSNLSSVLTIQSDTGANALSIIGRNNGSADEAVISFYEYDGTTRNAYIVKEAGELAFVTGTGGAPVEKLRLKTTSVVINETSADQDFRVESDNFTHALFVEGSNGRVNIGDATTPAAALHISTNANTTEPMGVNDSGANGATAKHRISFKYQTTEVGSVKANNSATTFNTSSDQRLKDNIVDAPSASDDIDAIQVRSFDWKVDGSHQKYGMVAQELNAVAPEAVSEGETEEEMMGVDYSKLVPMMLKEIQSLRARVADLES